MQHMRELLLPFAACSSARTAQISLDEAAMIADAARSLATRIRAAAAEKKSEGERGGVCAGCASVRTRRSAGERARGRARASTGHGVRGILGHCGDPHVQSYAT